MRTNNSFFGKIMGHQNNYDDEEMEERPTQQSQKQPLEYRQEFDIEPEELTDEDHTEEESVEVEIQDQSYEAQIPVQTMYVQQEEETYYPEPTPQPVQEPTPTQNNNQEWLGDYDGQLNIDMFQTKDNVILKSTIAGVRPDDIDITVANDMVSIKGQRRQEDRVNPEDYFYQECYWGNFSRSVIVPVDIDSENIEADLKDGILTIIIPKAAKAKTKKVRVKGA